MSELPAFILAAVALTGSPGPNTLSLAAVGAAFPRRTAVRYMAGLTLGMVLVIAIIGSGMQGLLLALPGAAPMITAVAALYFIYLAYRIATAPPLQANENPTSAPRWFEGMFLSLINPEAYAAIAAIFSGFTLVADNALADGFAKAAMLVATIIPVIIAWISIGAALTRFLRDPSLSRTINITFAALLLISVSAATML